MAGYANNEERTWALVAHFGGALGAFLSGSTLGWVAPLVALLAQGNRSPAVRAHSVAALNFHLTATIAAIIGYCLLVVPGLVVLVLAVIFGIIGGVRANEGQLYRYPLTINMVK